MPIDINKHEIDIDTLFKQNENDLVSIKELYKKLKEIEKKISQIKYIDTKLADKLKKDYEKLKKVILDENIQVQLNNRIDEINEISSQLDTNVHKLNKKINEVATTGTTTEVIQNKITEMAENGTITYNTVSPEMTTFMNVEKSINLFDKSKVVSGYYNKGSDGNITLVTNNRYNCIKIKIDTTKSYSISGCSYAIYFSDLNNDIAKGRKYPSGTTLIPNLNQYGYSGLINAYISFDTTSFSVDTYMIVEGDSMPSEYVPYYINNKLNSNIKVDFNSLINIPTIPTVEKTQIFTVGTDKDYATLTECLRDIKDNHKEKIIYIDGGNYDIFEEIGGSVFALSIDDTITSWRDVSIIIPDNTKIIGLGDVILDFSPSVDEISAKGSQYLSCLNVIYKNFYLENVTITCDNCRYGIHDETGGTYVGGIHRYKNVKVYKKSTSMGMSQAFGCGFSPKQTLDFDCCYFEAPSIPFSCHNNGSFDVDNAIIKAVNTIFTSNSNNTKSVRFGNVNGKQVKVCVNFSNCYIKNGVQVKNESVTERPNAYEVTLLNCNDIQVQILNSTNIYTAKVFR